MKRGRLIVIEGTDGSGKSTQFARLCRRAEHEGIAFQRLVFPQYQEESSALLRMYLNGEFGRKPGDVNAYAASLMFSMDRYASYKQDWGAFYEAGGLVIADRYTTSNAVHQASKLPPEERTVFLNWLFELEYGKLGLPKPDLVLYLDMEGICTSTGSACSTGSLDPSHVLMAIGLSHEVSHGSLRVTLGRFNTEEEVDYIIETLPKVVEKLRSMSPVWNRK